MNAIESRRQRAFDAAEEQIMSGERPSVAVLEAIEIATQVKITSEAIEAFDTERNGSTDAGNIRAGLGAALTALGLEVVD